MDGIGGDGAIVSALLEALPEPVVLVDADTRIASANRAARTVLPTLRAGEPLELALRTPDVLDCVRRVSASGKAETVSWRERVPVERVFDVHVAPLIVRNGSIGVVVITLRDLTDARSVERMRADFVANASHELRTPLATLMGFVETLQGPARDDPPARDRFLAIMREQAGRMARLLDDLLSLSRIEQNLHLRPEAPVDLVLVVRHLTETLMRLAQENGMTLEVVAPQPVIVTGDRDEIVRVAENLIENAIKYGAPPRPGVEPQVEISVTSGPREGVLVVRDHGPGIAPEHIPRLTERFYRVDAGQSRAKGGTGLGLAIVKHIVARHRGRLTIDSTLGQGATFVVALPLHR
ncbi:MAG: ATP-binding protein [Methylobacteriaceae bacterium]|nr:ATP-binding protein [Methylobacteriaceae bacterium]MBV9244514.1 ATP-binding protein [Methylobacteriaceae bacterium]MBV9634479.1 ATP-binding protein [Methylobacteriaceae bacterium]